MSEPQGPHIDAGKAWGYFRDLLAVGVLPILFWGVKLEVGNAERDLLITQQEKEIGRLEESIKENAGIDDKVTSLALKQATLEGKMDTALGRLDEIKSLVR